MVFPGFFAITFGITGFSFLFAAQLDSMFFLLSVLFVLIGVIATIITLTPIYRYVLLKIKGKKITGTFYGYMDDNIYLNGHPAQIIKILVHAFYIKFLVGH